MENIKNLSIIGLGKLGSSMVGAFASRGFNVIGVDINKNYLDLCKERFSGKLSHMKLICSDLNEFEFISVKMDVVHAALIFEYLDVEKLLQKISTWLKPNGYLSVVLQLESRTSAAISETEFQSLKLLSPIHNLIDPKKFSKMCFEFGFKEMEGYEVSLPGEKKFRVLLLQMFR